MWKTVEAWESKNVSVIDKLSGLDFALSLK